jgi:hypothetical protein
MTEIFSSSVQVTLVEALEALNYAIAPNGGTAIPKGHSVSINSSGALIPTTNKTTYPVGTVITPLDSATGKTVFRTNWTNTVVTKAKGGTINPGTLVSLNGAISDGVNEVAASTTGDFVYGVVIVGGAVDTLITVGVVPSFKF